MTNPKLVDFIWGEGQVLRIFRLTGATNDRHPTAWENRFMGFVAGAICMSLFIFTLDWLLT